MVACRVKEALGRCGADFGLVQALSTALVDAVGGQRDGQGDQSNAQHAADNRSCQGSCANACTCTDDSTVMQLNGSLYGLV